MQSIESTVSIPAGQQQVYQALLDIDFISSVIPGVVLVERKGEHDAEWVVEVKKGFLRRKMVFQVHFDFVLDREIALEAHSNEVSLKGRITVERSDATKTNLVVQLEYEASGPLKYIVNNVVGDMVKDVPQILIEKLNVYLSVH